jgi:hypothetical protein
MIWGLVKMIRFGGILSVMNQFWVNFGKGLLPVLFGVIGIAVFFAGLSSESPQTVWFILSGLVIFTGSVLWFLFVFQFIKTNAPLKWSLVFLIPSLVLSVLIFRSISTSLEYREKEISRIKVIIERLTKIREAQLAFKDVHGVYASNFDILLDFVKTGVYPVERRVGNIDDSLAVAAGLVRIDTVFYSVLGYKYIETFPIDSLPFVPFSSPLVKFVMESDLILTPEGIEMPVFAASTNYNIFLKDLYASYGRLSVDSTIQVGSLTEPTTTGNWREIK